MPTVAIPARTIPAGELVLGPVAVTRWRRAEIALDAADLINPILISVELSTDGGQSWRIIAAADFTGGTWLDRSGTPHTDIGLRFALRVDAQRDDQIRMRLQNTSPWQTAGGTLTVESDPDITLGPEHRSIALVSGQTGSAAADGSGTTLAVTVPSNVTAGNLIVSAVGSSTGAAAATSVTDGLSNTYTEASGSPYNSTTLSEYLGIWLAPNIAGGAAGNITANWGAATTFRRHAVAEFSGTATSSVQEGSMATGQGSSTSAATGNLSPTADGSMLIGWCNDASVPTIGSGFTSLATYGSDSLFEYRVQGTATAEPVTAGISPSAGWGIVGVIIKPAAGGGGGPALTATVAGFVANGANVLSSTGITITKAALESAMGRSLANGDVLYALCGRAEDTGGPWQSSSGGTWASLSPRSTSTGNDLESDVLRRIITNAAGEPSSYVFTLAGTTDTDPTQVILVCVQGADVSGTPEDGAVTSATGTNDATPNHVEIDTTQDGDLVLMFLALSMSAGSSARTAGAPSYADGLCGERDEKGGSVLDSFVCAAYKVNASLGTQTIGSWTGTDDATSEWHVHTVAIKSAPTAALPDLSMRNPRYNTLARM